MNILKPEKQLAVISALVEGNSIRSVERMTGVHRDTIMRLLVRVGEHCSKILDQTMRGLSCQSVQVDEIWTYVAKKERRLTLEEKFQKKLGDQYVFVAIDATTKLIPAFNVGKRDMVTAYRFMTDLKQRVPGKFQLTTDGYIGAVEMAWGADSPDFAQLIKLYAAENPGPGRYSPPRVSGTVSMRINGDPDPAKVSTSYVERQNLTIRMQIRRFTRLTNGFSKKLENLKAALALHFAWYNLVRIHRSLRITPAMAAGVTDRAWELGELLA